MKNLSLLGTVMVSFLFFGPAQATLVCSGAHLVEPIQRETPVILMDRSSSPRELRRAAEEARDFFNQAPATPEVYVQLTRLQFLYQNHHAGKMRDDRFALVVLDFLTFSKSKGFFDRHHPTVMNDLHEALSILSRGPSGRGIAHAYHNAILFRLKQNPKFLIEFINRFRADFNSDGKMQRWPQSMADWQIVLREIERPAKSTSLDEMLTVDAETQHLQMIAYYYRLARLIREMHPSEPEHLFVSEIDELRRTF